MINIHPVNIRNTLRYQSYVKALKEINKVSENPQAVLPDYYIDMDDISSIDYVPAVVDSLTKSIALDFPKQNFAEFISLIDENMIENFSLGVSSIIHFGLLSDHLYLFTDEEKKVWKTKMESLFKNFDDSFCYNFKSFFDSYFRHQFFGTESEYFQKFLLEMEYTFVLVFDYEWHSIEQFGPCVMKEFVNLNRKYQQFYRDLIDEIQSRKQGVKLIA
ncbi:hypothetical protein ABFV99_13730 [Cytobacillus horneckiae]|uniref:hypothetical protein n=1 Tax=Cytobacillus horneckiae TaxID=549687 RepID=UPI0034CE52C0